MSYDTLTRSRIAQIRTTITAVGAKLPKAVLEAQAEFDKVTAVAREYEPATRDQINEAVARCFVDGRDPADDETVRRLVTSYALVSEAGLNVNYAAEKHIVEALRSEADNILATLAGPTAEAGESLAKAHAIVGEETDPSIIMSMGVEAVEAWTNAKRADDLLRRIDGAWGALAHLTSFASPNLEPTLRLCDASLETFDKAGWQAAPWNIVRAGGTITLADRETFPQRVRRIQEARKRREDDAGRAVAEGYRRTHGVGVSA